MNRQSDFTRDQFLLRCTSFSFCVFVFLDLDRQAGLSEWLCDVYCGSEATVENQRLAVAAQITEEMRAAVYRDTGFRCSAGIGHNKVQNMSTTGKVTCAKK